MRFDDTFYLFVTYMPEFRICHPTSTSMTLQISTLRPSNAPLHTLSKLFDALFGFPLPLIGGLLCLWSPTGGCFLTSDNMSCSF